MFGVESESCQDGHPIPAQPQIHLIALCSPRRVRSSQLRLGKSWHQCAPSELTTVSTEVFCNPSHHNECMFTYPHCHYRRPAMPTYRIRTEPFLAETLRDESGASGDVHQRHPYSDQDGDQHRQCAGGDAEI